MILFPICQREKYRFFLILTSQIITLCKNIKHFEETILKELSVVDKGVECSNESILNFLLPKKKRENGYVSFLKLKLFRKKKKKPKNET